MDNRPFSVIKRGLHITREYAICLILVAILGTVLLGSAGTVYAALMFGISILVFLLLCMMIYTDMYQTAFKEKRPQYSINPSPFKGVLYGLIGIFPIWIVQLVVALVVVPQDILILRKRLFQLLSSPIYWLAKLMGNSMPVYPVALLIVVLVAFLGYWAGNSEFQLKNRIYRMIGYTPKPRKRPMPRRK